MKLIEAEKVEQAIKDYWKAQVDRAPIPKSTKEYNAYVNCLDAILERNDGLLKAIDELPSAEPESISKWKKEFREYVDSLDIARDDWKGIIEYIDELPSAQPERHTGEWIHQSKFGRIECDQCGKVFRNSFAPKNFCPNCGADMRGDKHEND